MRRGLYFLISEIQIYKNNENKENKTFIKEIKFTFDIDNIVCANEMRWFKKQIFFQEIIQICKVAIRFFK